MRYQNTSLDFALPHHLSPRHFRGGLACAALLVTLSPAEEDPEQTLFPAGACHLTFQGFSAAPTTNAILPTPVTIVMVKHERTNRERHGDVPLARQPVCLVSVEGRSISGGRTKEAGPPVGDVAQRAF